MSTEVTSLITADTTIKVSSTLDKSVGKKYLIDNDPETCWTSQQGLPQHIQINFAKPVIPQRISLTFQGGFVGTQCPVHAVLASSSDLKDWKLFSSIYPEDVNRRQTFDLAPASPTEFEAGIISLKLVFEQSSDFFGRITVYDLKLEGKVLDA